MRMGAHRSIGRLRPGRSMLLAVVGLLLITACTVSTEGQATRATPGAQAGLTVAATASASSSVAPSRATPTVTVTTVRKVAATPAVVYRVAPPVGRTAAPKLAALPWWGVAVDTNHTSSLTIDRARDDAASVYIPPTLPVQPGNAANQPNSAGGNVWSGVGLTGRTNGQVIGIVGRQAYTCSGTVVHSAAKNVVLTAGHCVWNIPVGKPAGRSGPAMTLLDTIWFVPGASQLSNPLTLDAQGQPDVQAPYGIWKVDGARTNDRWLKNTWVTESGRGLQQTELMHGAGSYDDIAFARVQALNGREIETVTGAQGLMFSDTSNAATQISYPTVVLGYPTAAPFDGSAQRYCAQRLPDTFEGDAVVQTAEISCGLTPGSSGGAWFTGFDNVLGVGYVYGVTSRGGDSRLTVGLLSLADDYPLYLGSAG